MLQRAMLVDPPSRALRDDLPELCVLPSHPGVLHIPLFLFPRAEHFLICRE